MIVLGWHGSIRREHEDMAPGWSVHDGAAVLLRDGEVVAAIEEERLNRIKHSNFFPARAIRTCLKIGAIDLREVDCVALNLAERTSDIFPGDIGRPAVDLYLEETHRRGPTVRDMINELFLDEFGIDVSEKLYFCHHHLAHLWSAWGPATFDDALLISFDGSGDGLSGMVALGHGNEPIRQLQEYDIKQSLGNLYADSIRLVGYRRFDEYKAMGLAPYGHSERFRDLFDTFYRLLPDGNYRLADRANRWARIQDAGLIPQARRAGEPFAQLHADFAAALQETLETIAMHVISHFQETTGNRNLCYAGGVAHNCSLNGTIAYSGLFDRVFIQPASHDAGGALGAALAAAHQLVGSNAKITMTDVFVGKNLADTEAVLSELECWRDHITTERVDDPATVGAELIASGSVIGWVQGRSEFGPRALGHRSILADPRPASNKEHINEIVKKRESFRPFAPAVQTERMNDVFQLPPTEIDYSYMTFTLRAHEEMRAAMGAVTHIDGTARVQSVSRDTNERFWDLISAFERIAGVPAVLNTSFNNNAEPIVDSVTDAVACFLTTGLDALIVDDFLVRKRTTDLADATGRLRPRLANCRKLVVRAKPVADEGAMATSYHLESTASRYFVDPTSNLSADAFHVLLKADGNLTLTELYEACEVHESHLPSISDEMVTLWAARSIVFEP